MKYLKKFGTHTEYEAYINGSNKVLPNVSYVVDNNGVYYNPIEPPSRVIRCTINVETTSNPTVLVYENGWSKVESVLITRPNGNSYEITYNDLVQYDPRGYDDPTMGYQFDTIGNHTIEYTLKPNVTSLDVSDMFDCNYNVISIIIPNCITSIGAVTFLTPSLITLILPNSITSLGADRQDGILQEALNLTSVTILATTPPECNGIFLSERDGYTIYVPSESVDAYKAAEGWSYYASKIQAIPTT